jgi:hypothetical protein
MPLNSKFKQTIARISSYEASRKLKCPNTYVFWIISRYIYYLFEAVIHGYKINVYYKQFRQASIELVYTPVEKVSTNYKEKYLYSSRVFGNMFFILITGKYMQNDQFHFYLDRKIRERITKIINTDTIYQYIRS